MDKTVCESIMTAIENATAELRAEVTAKDFDKMDDLILNFGYLLKAIDLYKKI